jgi:predicted kinase
MAKLTLICGIPGSGKSTLCAHYAADGAIVLSSDGLRAVIGTGEADQSVSGIVFKTMEHMTAYFLSRGIDVVIDATNCNRKSRKNFVTIGRKYKAFIVARVSQTDLETCKARNRARERVVPEHVLDNMWNGFEQPTTGIAGEVDSIAYF